MEKGFVAVEDDFRTLVAIQHTTVDHMKHLRSSSGNCRLS